MRLVCISDTHRRHADIKLPAGDVLIHAGDACSRGTWDEFADFACWFEAQKHKHKIFVPGNHDICLEGLFSDGRRPTPSMFGFDVLVDSGLEIDGVTFYGAPWQRHFCGWAFQLRQEELANKWRCVEPDTGVLITHAPPLGVLDATERGEQVGDPDLRQLVMHELRELEVHVFGHIHHSAGVHRSIRGPTFVNAAICGENYEPINAPTVVDI